MKVICVGSLAWTQGKLSLRGWQIDLEGEDYSQRQLELACARCAIEVMMEDVGIDIEVAPSFEVERLAADVIFAAAVTSSPAMMREIAPKWWQRFAWWQ